MSRVIREKASEEKAAGPESPVSETRIDPAHPVEVGSGQPSARSTPEAFRPRMAPACPSEEPDEALHRQAGQLAEYLRLRQSELDHRQTRLNAQLALLESETRAAQLWINEREAELHERRRELTGRQRELAQRLERLAAAESALRRRAGTAEDTAGDRSIFPAEKSGQSPCDTQSPESFLQERRRFQEEMQSQRQRIAAAERQALREVEKKRQALQRRSEHLDRCQAALRVLRDQLQQMHRETLEIRLAAEELWIRMAGAAPPAALTLAVERIRGQLADQYRSAGAELAERKQELETLREELAAQCTAFADHKKQFTHWAAARREQLEIQAQRLAEREQLLEGRRLAS